MPPPYGVDRSEAARIGITGRLDTLQAAVLIEKLKIFPDEIEARNRVAAQLMKCNGHASIYSPFAVFRRALVH